MSVMNFALQLTGSLPSDFDPPRPAQRCQATDQGVSIVVQVLGSAGQPVNLRVATSIAIATMRPSGIIVITPAALYTNGLDGKMSFVSSAMLPFGSGLSEAGVWQVQGAITIGGNKQLTSIGAFSVDDNLGA